MFRNHTLPKVMLRTVAGILEKDGRLRLLEKLDLRRAQRMLVTLLEEEEGEGEKPEVADTVLLSEAALGEDWNRPEEDEAWQHLQ